MKWISRLVATALLGSAASLHAQALGQNSAPSTPAPALCDPEQFEPGSPLEVIGKAAGLDRRYLWSILRSIRSNSREAIPADALSSADHRGCATVEFSIATDGRLESMKLVESSGDPVFERAAQAGITASAPFPTLPEQFAGDALTLRFHFRYHPGQRGGLIESNGHLLGSSAGTTETDPPAVEAETYQGGPVYRIGADVKPPKPIYQLDPEYDDRARKKRIEGTVILDLIVTPAGIVDDVKITQALDPGLDKKALEAVRQWRFEPSTKDGKPVPVKIKVEVSFRLYGRAGR